MSNQQGANGPAGHTSCVLLDLLKLPRAMLIRLYDGSAPPKAAQSGQRAFAAAAKKDPALLPLAFIFVAGFSAAASVGFV